MDLVTVLLPHGQTVMVHKGWQPRSESQLNSATYSDTRSRPLSPQSSRTLIQVTSSNLGSPPQPQRRRRYRFITSTPENKNGPETLRTIRRHVRNELIGCAKERMMCTEKDSRARSQEIPKPHPESSILAFDKHLLAPSTSFSDYPINMQLHTHVLLDKYLTYASSRMFPVGCSLRTSPLKTPEWFHFAVTDAAMLHAMCYAAAIYLALLEGRRESQDTLRHQNQTISIVQKRLGTSDHSSNDATLGAISCLAIGGAISGDVHIWHRHMRGLREMIHARGNISSLTPLLQTKLRRSDVTGAIDYGLVPYLELPPSPTPPIWSILPASTISQISSQMASLLSSHFIHPSLTQKLTLLSFFTRTLVFTRLNPNITLLPEAFSNDLYSLEHSLLSFPSTLLLPAHECALSASLRFSALIYLKAVLQEFPHSVNGPRILVEKVREGLSMMGVDEENEFGEEGNKKMKLVTWVCVVCAAVSKGKSREWFLRKLTNIGKRYDSGEQAQIEGLLSLKSIFGEECIAKVWEEVKTMSRTMRPEIYSRLLSTRGLGLFFH
ncbi:hypothetical protein N431DRAFT_437034 [Stipitochalara longipes BDJ]|nr:hypothetical protein N431DRAFT_437034 [Stipitochalara longipes BDJ]